MSIAIGDKFGRLTVTDVGGFRLRPNGKKRRLWRCACSCGHEKTVLQDNLIKGTSTSCGCLHVELLVERCTTHGHAGPTPEYRTWQAMRNRCTNQHCDKFKHYGGRGIRVCERWDSFENFLADMGLRPSDKPTLDRINPDGNYEPGNCRWATWKQQRHNRRQKE
jgi:hypothetical protein